MVMKGFTMKWFLVIGISAATFLAFGQSRIIKPEDPVEAAKSSQRAQFLTQAHGLIANGHVEQAIPLLEQACAVEVTMAGFQAQSRYELAQAFQKMGRSEQAMAALRNVFRWDTKRNDLMVGTSQVIEPIMDYAILLARDGKAQEAKAIYYFGLRNFNLLEDRDKEPVPMLVVFDADPEGVVWDYSPERLEAAALMAKVMTGPANTDREKAMLVRIEELAPEWFLPTMLRAAGAWNTDRGAQLLAQAEALAKPGLEQDLVAKYKVDLRDHRARVLLAGTAGAEDRSPMTDGNVRRSRIQCLRPNADLLRRLSSGG
jgi:tetratricopeptide (TPR) repeat protein